MASGSKRDAVEVVFRWYILYINKVVHYAIHHHYLGVRSSALQCLPLELLQPVCDNACALAISSGKPGGSTYCLNLVDTVLNRIFHWEISILMLQCFGPISPRSDGIKCMSQLPHYQNTQPPCSFFFTCCQTLSQSLIFVFQKLKISPFFTKMPLFFPK